MFTQLGIHLMELKAGGKNLPPEVKSVQNPFNGIESFVSYLVVLGVPVASARIHLMELKAIRHLSKGLTTQARRIHLMELKELSPRPAPASPGF